MSAQHPLACNAQRQRPSSDGLQRPHLPAVAFAKAGASIPRCVVIIAFLFAVGTADAQTWGARGTLDLGATWFAAAESFKAVLDSQTGTIVGGGGEVVFPQRVFAAVRWSRFERSGERVFVFQRETFKLGIDTTVRITPVEITGGYRFPDLNRRFIPYVGGGVGWHRYTETSEFADQGEDVEETHRGYHVLGGTEFRLGRWFSVGGEVQWTTVPDALGQDPNSVSAEFREDDLGGTALRVKFLIGR